MKNVELIRGKCAICGGPIDIQWAGEDPSLGTKCQNCSFKNSEPEVFSSENVEIHVQKQVIFDPLFGRYEYDFDWQGTKISVNGEIGIVRSTQGDCAWVDFESGKKEKRSGIGEPIQGLGYWDILRIYKESGGETEPPVLNLPPYVPEKVNLLDEPILPVNVERDEKQNLIRSIRVGERRDVFVRFGEGPELPVLRMFHAFANLYVCYKFGLAPNLCCEGGDLSAGTLKFAMPCLDQWPFLSAEDHSEKYSVKIR